MNKTNQTTPNIPYFVTSKISGVARVIMAVRIGREPSNLSKDTRG